MKAIWPAPGACVKRRYFFANNLYACGVKAKNISMLLGHFSVEIAYNRYIHFLEGEIDDALWQAVVT